MKKGKEKKAERERMVVDDQEEKRKVLKDGFQSGLNGKLDKTLFSLDTQRSIDKFMVNILSIYYFFSELSSTFEIRHIRLVNSQESICLLTKVVFF